MADWPVPDRMTDNIVKPYLKQIDRLERAYDYLWKAFDVARVAPNITPKLQEHITKILQNADVIRNGEE